MSIQVISFNCVLKNDGGEVLCSTSNREVLNISQGPTEFLPGLAKGLHDLIAGEKRTISVSAQEAYGMYDPKRVILYPRKKLNQKLHKLAIDEIITIVGKCGTHREYKIVKFYDDLVSLDGNHPHAGQDLVFEIEVLAARNATSLELGESRNVFSSQRLH